LFIGVAQEYARTFRSTARKRRDGSLKSFEFYRGSVPVNQYYFYVFDDDWGPAFIKFSSYVPFGIKVCLNGHEWAKRQLEKRGIAFEALDNGFRSCADPERLQKLCDSLGAEHVDRFFRKWLARLPHPFSRRDRAAGFRYQLSIWQMELSWTHVFDRPVHGRQFFEEVLRENLDLGRPDRIQLLFGRRVNRRTPSSFRTRVVQHGVLPKLSVEYKRSRVKQYFKEGRALRTETVINDPRDVGVGRLLKNLDYLRTVAHNINHRLVSLERTSQNCVISARTFESFVLPSQVHGQRAPALRFGDPRIKALLAALCLFLPAHDGLTNALLRERVAAQLGLGPGHYKRAQMTYDLRRARLKGLIQRVGHKNRYVLTPIGRRVALFFTKTYARIFRPAVARIDPGQYHPADSLAAAYRFLDREIDRVVCAAKLAA
jgi:hypothetical protein